MALSILINRSGPYTTDGLAVNFAYGFKILEDTDLRVFQRTTATGDVSELSLSGGDYTVTGAGDAGGGNVVISPAPASGYEIVILRALTQDQETDLSNQGGWFPEVHEATFDYITMLCQDLSERVDRSVVIGESDESFTDTLNGDRAGKYVGFDVDGNPALFTAEATAVAGTIGTRIGVTGADSLAQGANNTASGIDSHASGQGSVASGLQSYAGGKATTASGAQSHAEGVDTTASGIAAHAEGDGTTASGLNAHSEGLDTVASGTSSHAEGSSSTASGLNAHVEGLSTTASGHYSHAEGAGTTASSWYSHAEGGSTEASGFYAHAEGASTVASGDYSHAEGGVTEASGTSSHAEGSSSTASGLNAHSEGSNTTASGHYAHAEGYTTVASALGAHAQGLYSIARLQGQHAHACDRIAANGDCQFTRFILNGETTDATPLVLSSPGGFTLEDETTYGCTVTVLGRRDTGANDCHYKRKVTIERTGGTVALSGAVSTIGTDQETDAGFDVGLTANDTLKTLAITVTGAAGYNMAWTAMVEALELAYSD